MQQKSELQAAQELRAKIDTKLIHQGRIITLRVDTLTIPGHPPRSFDLVEHPGAVVILPITKNNEIVLVRQWRRSIGKIIYELPAGTLEKDEDPSECAQRELQEEAGFKADTLVSLGSYYSAPGFCNECLHLFLAKDLKESSLPHDETEAIDVLIVPFEEALKMIDDGKIEDMKTLAGIFRYIRWSKHGT